MKQELKNHLLPLLAILVITSFVWIFKKVVWYDFVFLFFGFAWGSFLLDLDHLIYWLYLEPNLEESHLAQNAWKKGDYLSIIKLMESTQNQHTNLIFHHYFFQIVLTIISFFVFTSSSSVFPKAFLLAINLHLLVDEIKDFSENPEHLRQWLFARENKQLALNSLKYYLGIFVLLNLIFSLLLISSK